MAYRYSVVNPAAKEVCWNGFSSSWLDHPTLAEVIEAAKKEFPDSEFDQLIITASGWDAEVIELRRKS
ncbi:MAG TPA: hypothetical protein VJC06_03195 [Candidatus Paceibacterota bacterium]